MDFKKTEKLNYCGGLSFFLNYSNEPAARFASSWQLSDAKLKKNSKKENKSSNHEEELQTSAI